MGAILLAGFGGYAAEPTSKLTSRDSTIHPTTQRGSSGKTAAGTIPVLLLLLALGCVHSSARGR